VTFMTLEDETGFVNVVLWRDVFARHEHLVRTAHLLGVAGRVEREGAVTHLIAERIFIPPLPETPALSSHDFR